MLTAAHCLYNFKDERWTIPMEVHFVAGYHRGDYREHARAYDFTVSPNWVPDRAKDESNIGNDWALVELERSLTIEPVPLSSRSFQQMKQAAADGELTIAGYNGDYAEILTEDHGCQLVAKAEGGRLLLHDCDATFGSSGAPLLLVTPDSSRDHRPAERDRGTGRRPQLRRRGSDRGLPQGGPESLSVTERSPLGAASPSPAPTGP